MSPPTWMAWARLSSMGRISCCCPEAANVRWIASPFAVARTLMSLLIRSSAVVSKAVHCSGISSSSHLRKPDARIAAPWRKGCNSCGSWQRRSNRWVGAHFRWISADQSRIVCKGSKSGDKYTWLAVAGLLPIVVSLVSAWMCIDALQCGQWEAEHA